MREEVHRYLDGEAALSELSPAARAEARAWSALLEEARATAPRGAPAGVAARVLEEIGSGVEPWWRRALAWWVRPRPVRVSPLVGLAAAATIAAVVLVAPVRWGGETGRQVVSAPAVIGPAGPVSPVRTAAGAPRGPVYVQFLMWAPTANSVAVAGDFNDWRPDIVLQDPDGDGIWAARVPLDPGVHRYMFVIDGREWVTDPYAERYADDGFGNRNAILALAAPSGT